MGLRAARGPDGFVEHQCRAERERVHQAVAGRELPHPVDGAQRVEVGANVRLTAEVDGRGIGHVPQGEAGSRCPLARNRSPRCTASSSRPRDRLRPYMRG